MMNCETNFLNTLYMYLLVGGALVDVVVVVGTEIKVKYYIQSIYVTLSVLSLQIIHVPFCLVDYAILIN